VNLQFATGFGTYKKRSGTGDQGRDYEKLMCALFALKFSTSDIVADFEMKTNSNDCGDFDDVVLKMTFVDGQSEMFLLQLKHSENTKNVTNKDLEDTGGNNNKYGNFSLLKYEKSLKSIRTFENVENISFILYTNKSTSIESDSKIRLKNEDNPIQERVVRELQDLDDKRLLLWTKTEKKNEKKGTRVFQFELDQSAGLHDHFKRFYFFADQTNRTGARSLINAMLREECGITDATYSSSFIEFMETWYSGNTILTKHDVVAKLAMAASP
jgi:hypothetical protein